MKVCLYGATGLTGSLIARELSARGVPLVVSGRSPKRLAELAENLASENLEVRAAPADAPAALAEAMAGCDVVVSAAGPFSAIGEPIIAAAIDAGASYLDTTGEQAFMRDIYERYESRARKRGVAVVPGFAFEVAIGDLAAACAAQSLGGDGPMDEVVIGYAFDELHTSRGTRLSLMASLAAGALVWDRDRWESVSPAAERRRIAFPLPFGTREAVSFASGEVITVPRHIATRRAQAYVTYGAPSSAVRWAQRALSAFGPAIAPIARSPVGDRIRDSLGQIRRAPDESARRASRFAVVAECHRGFARTRVAVCGADPYGLSSRIIALGVTALAGDHGAGVLAPADIVDAGSALATLARDADLRIERSA
ncbi:MAG TPA: saccharopine dehydrogenase NADP-binding domain-containing protein [Kofleriaceae bacterium]|nr:saccharopine dehydrogenase NADP-binding domain-containing protein [Kofleriaceae bacterium]